MKNNNGFAKLLKIRTAASAAAAIFGLTVAIFISVPGLTQNILFHLLGASEPTANFTTTSSSISESAGVGGAWPPALANWTARRPIVVEGVTAAVSNFPLLLKLDSTKINYANTLSLGADLRFADSSGNLMEYEVESWDSSGTSYVWVKIPTLAAEPARSVLWMYYGNSSATSAANASGVWSAAHSKVLHLNGAIGSIANGSSIIASTGVNATAVNSGGSGLAFVSGVVGNAVQFDGIDDSIAVGGDATLNFAASAPFTVSAYVKTTETAGPLIAFRDSVNGNNVLGLYLGFNGATSLAGRMNILMRDTSGGTHIQIQGPIVNDGAWHHVAVTRNAGNLIELLVDGISYGTASSAATGGAFTTDLRFLGVDQLWVNGSTGTADQRYFAGTLDEIRISGIQQSSSYFRAQSLAVQDGLAYFLSEETPSLGTAPITVSLNVPAISTVTIPYVVSGTATAGTDHNRVSGNLVIGTGSSSGSLSIQVLKDQIVEANETAVLTLGAATGAMTGNDFVHTLTITDEVLAPPVAVDDTVSATSFAAIAIPVLANDTDANGDFLTVSSFTNPANGSVTKFGRTLYYTPTDDFSGSDSFTYTISDGRGGSDTGTVTINFQIPFTWTGLGGDSNWSTGGNWIGGVAPGAANTAYFNDQCSANCNPLFGATLTIGGLRLNTSYVGTFSQGTTVVTLGSGGYRQRGGTFVGGSAAFTTDALFSVLGGSFQATSALSKLTSGNFAVTVPGTFSANGGTLQLACGYAVTCNISPGVADYNHVLFTGHYAGFDLGSGTMNVLGNLSMGDTYGAGNTAQPVSNGTFQLYGDYSVINNGVRGNAVVRMMGNPSGQTITGLPSLFMPRLTVASGANQVTFVGELGVANYFTYESGTVVTTGSTLWVHCDYGLTCTFTPGTVAYNHLRLSSYYGNFSLGGGTATVLGNLTVGDTFGAGYLNQQLTNGTFNVSGNISISPFGYRGNAVLNSVGGNSSISASATVGVPQGTVTVDKNAKTDTLTFGSNLSFSGVGQAMNLTEGTVDLAGYALGVNGTLTIGANAKLECNGGTVTAGATVINGEVSCGSSIGITWTGLAGDGLWSTAGNWTDNTVPGASDIAVFSDICGVNCNVALNSNVSVRGVKMLSTYTGTITQGAGVTVTVAAGGWTQASGTFTGSDSAITMTSSLAISGGVFTAPAATLTLGQPECVASKTVLNMTGGTFNHGNGRLKFNQGRPIATSCNGNFSIVVPAGFTAYDLEFNAAAGGSGWYSVINDGTGTMNPIKVLHNFYDYGPTVNFNIDAEGDVFLQNTNAPGSGILRLMGTADQKINTNAATPSQLLRIVKTSGIVLPEVGVTNIWLYGLDLVQGSFTAPTGNLTLGISTSTNVTMNSLAVASGTTFTTNGGTVRFTLSRTGSNNVTSNIVVPAGFEFNNVAVSTQAQSGGWFSFINSATPLIVAGNLSFGGDVNYANWQVRGDVSHVGTAPAGGTGSITLNGSTNQTLSGVSTARASSIVIASTGGTVTLSGTIVAWGNFTYTSGVVDPGTSTVIFGAFSVSRSISPGTMTFNNVTFQGYTGTLNITGTLEALGSTVVEGTSASPPLMLNGGTILSHGNVAFNSNGASGTTLIKIGGSTNQTVSGGAAAVVSALAVDSSGGTVTLSGTLNVGRGYDHINGTVDASTSTINFGANSLTAAIVPGGTLFNNVSFGGFVATYNLTGTLSTSGTLTLASSSSSPAQSINTGTLNPRGALTFSSNGSIGTAPITFSGLTASNYTIGASAQRPSGLVTVDKTGGAAVNLASNVSLVSAGQDLLVNQGVFNLSGFDLSVVDTLTIASGTTVRCSGGGFTSAVLSNSGTIECPGYSTYPFNWTGNAADGNFATAGNWQGGNAPASTDVVVFNSSYCGANCDSTISTSASVKGVQLEAGYLGTLTQGAGATMTIGTKGWQQTGGTFVGGDSTMLVNGVTNINGGTFTSTSGVLHSRSSVSRTATFNHNGGKWRFSAPNLTTRTVTLGTLTLNDVEFYSQSGYDSFTQTISGTVSVLGDLSFTRLDGSAPGTLNGGGFFVQGDVTSNTNFYGNIAVHVAGSANQTITGSLANSTIPNLTIASAGGVVSFVGTPTLYRSLTHTSGTVDFGTSTVTLSGQFGTAYTLNVPLLSFQNLTFLSECNRDTLPFNITGTLTVLGNLQLIASCSPSSINTGTVAVHGNVSTSGSVAWTGTASFNLTGSSNSTISQSGSGSFARGSLNVSKTAATVSQTTAISLPFAAQTFTVQSGTHNMAGFGLTVGGAVTNNSVLSRGTSPSCGAIVAGSYSGTAAICP